MKKTENGYNDTTWRNLKPARLLLRLRLHLLGRRAGARTWRRHPTAHLLRMRLSGLGAGTCHWVSLGGGAIAIWRGTLAWRKTSLLGHRLPRLSLISRTRSGPWTSARRQCIGVLRRRTLLGGRGHVRRSSWRCSTWVTEGDRGRSSASVGDCAITHRGRGRGILLGCLDNLVAKGFNEP